MFKKLVKTQYPPTRPLMVWDGNCGFCRYWITRWKRFTKERLDYESYQDVAERMPDIEIKHFKKASRLIEPDGLIYSGPRSAYRTFTYGSFWGFLDKWYVRYSWFEKVSDWLYTRVERNRSFLFKVTKALFGSDPENVRPFWIIYFALIFYFIYISIFGRPL